MNYGIQELHNQYSGRATIVGNGPSLDFDSIEGPSFAMNSISLAFPKTDWRPDFYCCFSRETVFSPTMVRRINQVVYLGIPCFLYLGYAGDIGQEPNVHYLGVALSGTAPPTDGHWFQDGKWVYSWATTMTTTIQIAQYLGFTDFKVVGVDGYIGWTRGEKDPNHFDGSYCDGITPPQKLLDAMAMAKTNVRHEIAYKHIEHELAKHGCTIEYENRHSV